MGKTDPQLPVTTGGFREANLGLPVRRVARFLELLQLQCRCSASWYFSGTTLVSPWFTSTLKCQEREAARGLSQRPVDEANRPESSDRARKSVLARKPEAPRV
jgi:hypothetical protein